MIWVYIVLYLMIGWFIEVTFDEEGAAPDFPFMLTLLWPIAIGVSLSLLGIWALFWPITWLARRNK